MLNCPVKAFSEPSHDLKCSESAWTEVSRREIKSVLPLYSALWMRPCVLSNLDLQIDYSSNLFCASSIVLSSIKCHSWRSIFHDSWVCVKRQNHKPVLSFRETIHFKWRIITLSHWLFLYEPPHFMAEPGAVREQVKSHIDLSLIGGLFCSKPFGTECASIYGWFIKSAVSAPRYKSQHIATVINYVLERQYRV